MNLNYRGLFQDWEITIATKLVKEYRRKWICLNKEESEDLLQECLAHWYFAKDEYKPKHGASQKTFMARIIRNKLIDLIREREADKRKVDYLAISLDEPLGDDEDDCNLIDLIDENNINDDSSDHLLEIQLNIDLSKALHKLTPQQKRLCKLLRDNGLNIKEVSEYLKSPRSNIYDELKRIRRVFMKEGLQVYLE